MHPITCVAGEWKLDRVNDCTILDGGTSSLDGGQNG
jgi:hypothetical protein